MKLRAIGASQGNLAPAIAAIAMGVAAGVVALSAPEPKMIVAAVFAMTAMLIAIVRIDWGIALLSFITYAGIADALSRVYGIPLLVWPLIGMLVLAALLHWILLGGRTSGWAKPALFIVLYWTVCGASLVWTADPDRTLQMMYELSQGVVIALAVLFLLQDESGARKAVLGIIAAGALVGTINMYQYFTGTFNNIYWGLARAELRQITIGQADFRITGPTGDANFFAQIMLAIVPIAAERAWNEKRLLPKALAIYSLLVSLGCVIFTFSRGAFLAMVLLIGLVLLRARPRPSQWVALILAGVIALSFAPREYKDRILTLTEVLPWVEHSGAIDPAIKGRAKSAAAGLLMFIEHPLVGVGYGNYPRFYQQYSRRMGVDPHLSDRSAHSMYIEIATEGGLLGITAFAMLIGLLLVRLSRARKWLEQVKRQEEAARVSAIYYAIVAYLSASIFLHSAYPRYFWLLIGIGFALPKAILAQKETGEEEAALLEKSMKTGGAAC